MSEPLVALLQPSYSRSVPNKHAAKAFYRPSLRGINRLEIEQGTSMLTRCFNMLWCDAINARSAHAITHVAMIHDDICPDPGWLDVLMDELESTGADMISAVIPIKNERGLTSTSVDIGDPWIVRRLTMHEVFQMPPTFSASDVSWNPDGKPLLLNTGLWLAKFDPAWVEQISFKFVNRIVKMPDGVWMSQDIPEDWDFSRQLHAFGCKLLATRKVGLYHQDPQFHNRHAWGTHATDMDYLQFQQLLAMAGKVPEGFRFPLDVAGWLTEIEGLRLSELALGRDVLEIGSYCGRSTICLAHAAKSVAAVDPFDGRATTAPRDTLADFMGNLITYGVLEKVTAYKGESELVLPNLEGRFDLVFIDGNHSREAVLRDAEMARAKLLPGGLLAFHDYRRNPGDHDGRWDPEVTAVVNELVEGGATLLDVTGTVATLSWPA